MILKVRYFNGSKLKDKMKNNSYTTILSIIIERGKRIDILPLLLSWIDFPFYIPCLISNTLHTSCHEPCIIRELVSIINDTENYTSTILQLLTIIIKVQRQH